MQLIQPQAVTVIAPVSHGKAARYLHATRPMIVAPVAMAVAAAVFVTVIHASVAASLALILLACDAAPMGVIFISMAVIVVSAARVVTVVAGVSIRPVAVRAAVMQRAAAGARRRKGLLGGPVTKPDAGRLQGRRDLIGTGRRRPGARRGHGLPGNLHRLRERRNGVPGNQQDVGVRRRHSRGPAPAAQLLLSRQADCGRTGHGRDQHMWPGRAGPQQRPGQAHRRAPSRHAYATPASSTARNANISITALGPTAEMTSVHGYMKIISMSKARNSIVIAYQRTW